MSREIDCSNSFHAICMWTVLALVSYRYIFKGDCVNLILMCLLSICSGAMLLLFPCSVSQKKDLTYLLVVLIKRTIERINVLNVHSNLYRKTTHFFRAFIQKSTWRASLSPKHTQMTKTERNITCRI